MGALRRIALGILWALAVVGIACGVVWGLTAAGVIKPLVVISGSMEPGIMTGDLLVATKVPAGSLDVGDVVSLPSEINANLVTHRIVSITAAENDAWAITMKGDNNEFEDVLDYAVPGEVWMPQLQLPGVGTAITRLTTPVVAVPLILGLIALLGITWLVPAPARRRAEASATPLDADSGDRTVGAVASDGGSDATAPTGGLTRREYRALAEGTP